MMRKRIVYTRPDGSVSICCPTRWAIDTMSCGGMFGPLPRGALNRMIERSIAGGRPPDAAARFIRALHFGGCTEAESLAVIRDRDCAPHGTAIELWDADEVPRDRWFREAWRRSHNGGPVSINLKLAKRIQFRRIREAVAHVGARREKDIDLFDTPVEVNWGRIRDQIHAAQDEVDLRRVWPEELARWY